MENIKSDAITFDKQEFQDWNILCISGRVDTVTSNIAESRAKILLDENKNLALDLAHLEYISSAGLRVLLRLAKKAKSTKKLFALISVNGLAKEVLEESGLDVLFTIVNSKNELL